MPLSENLRQTLNMLNPFYRNKIQGMADFMHLNGTRVQLLNPHLARQLVSELLVANRDVLDAAHTLYGYYVLDAAIIGHELRVNVHEIFTDREDGLQAGFYNPMWIEELMMQFTLEVDDKKGVIQPLTGAKYGLYYGNLAPEQSWTIVLDRATQQHLGMKLLGNR